MEFVPQWPKKAQGLLCHDFEGIDTDCEKRGSEKFVGGRKGYKKSFLFKLLLVKQMMGWSLRVTSEMGGISHTTLVRANQYFLRKRVYEKYYESLVTKGLKKELVFRTTCSLG